MGYYRKLFPAGRLSGAWFRQLALRGEQPFDVAPDAGRAEWVDNEFDSTFAAFSGGRAIADNLALDRELILGEAGGDDHVYVQPAELTDGEIPADLLARIGENPIQIPYSEDLYDLPDPLKSLDLQ